MAESDALTRAKARHLLRRTSFGVTPAEIDRLLSSASTVGAAADRLVTFRPKGFKPGGRYFSNVHDAWFGWMLKTTQPLAEKMTLFWHDHFATAYSKVQSVKLMAQQNQFLRLNCVGDFRSMVKGINRDPAMIEFLDTTRNEKEIPNENYARELQELFTLGTKNLRGGEGDENYTQADIVQIARAFTGWSYSRTKPVFRDWAHDYDSEFGTERGPKVVYRSTGGFGPGGASFSQAGEGATEIDQVVDVIFRHRDWEGENTVARRLAKRLFEFFVGGRFAQVATPSVELDAIDEVILRSGFTTRWNVGALVREILVHDRFFDSLSDRGRKSVRWPVDVAVGTMRVLAMKPKGKYKYVPGGQYGGLLDHLRNMGQTVLEPPSVFGWDWESSWISSATLLARHAFVRDVAARWAEGFAPLALVSPASGDPAVVVDAVTEYLGVKDDLSPAEIAAFRGFLGGPVDLSSDEQVRRKIHGLFVLVMQSPAYQLH